MKFPFGAQYYRPPTPPKEQWSRDIKNMAGMGMNIARAWLCWNWLNPAPGKFDFDDPDRFIELLAKNKMKALMLISLESTPQWVVDDNPDALFKAHDDYLQYPEGFGNTPAGGFPGLCLDNKNVKLLAAEYIKALVGRYADSGMVFAWEPHNEPIIEPCRRKFDDEDIYCYCEASISEFRRWLRAKYRGSIAALNEVWHRKYNSFDEVRPPKMQRGGTLSDFVEWRVFWMENLAAQLKWRGDQVRQADPKAKIMMHTRAYSCVQGNTATWGMDDWRLAQQVDIYGGSMFFRGYPDEAYFLNNEAIASAAQGRPWFLAEVQGGPPNGVGDSPGFARHYTAEHMAQWTWIPISQGSKGFMYWQYRMELAPPEYGYGLTGLDGEPTARTREVKRIRGLLKKHEDFLIRARAPKTRVAFGYAPENTILEFLATRSANRNYDQLMGLYKTLLFSDLTMDIVRLDDGVCDSDLSNYDILAISGARWIGPKTARRIEKFVRAGGVLVSDIGLEYDDKFFWCRKMPGCGLNDVFGCRRETVGHYPPGTDITATWQGRKIRAAERRERVALTTGKALACWDDDQSPAIVANMYGKGRAYYMAGEFFLNFYEKEDPGLFDFMRWEVTKNAARPVATTAAKIIPRMLTDGKAWLVFAFNTSNALLQSELEIQVNARAVSDFETGRPVKFSKNGGSVVLTATVPAKGTKIFRLSR